MLQVDETGITPEVGPRIVWSELQRVCLVTTTAAAGNEVYFAVQTGENQVLLPHDADLLRHLQKLPGFDNTALLEGLASSEDAEIPLWTRS